MWCSELIIYLSPEKPSVTAGKNIACSQLRAQKKQTLPLSTHLCKTRQVLHLAVAPSLKKANVIFSINQEVDVGTRVVSLLFAGSNQVARLGG